MAERVAVLSPDGQFGTVDSADAEAVVRAGGRVLTKAEATEQALAERYSKQSVGSTVAKVASLAGPVPYAAGKLAEAAGVLDPSAMLPPELEAYKQGVSSGFTGGVASLAEKEAVRLVGGDKAARAYAQTAEDVKLAHEGYRMAGEAAGFLGGAVAGGTGAAAKAIPGVGISALGGLAEQGVARAGANLAAKGAIGRALTTGGSLAARGAAEGVLYGAANSITEDMLGDREVNADKLWAAVGSGAMFGAAGGGVLGAGGSLAKSGALATTGAIGRALSKPAKLVSGAAVAGDAAQGEARAAVAEGAQALKTEAERATAGARNAVAGEVEATQREAAKTAEGLAELTGTNVAQEKASLLDALAKAQTKDEQKRWSFRLAWNAIGAGMGLQTTKYAKQATTYLKNGVDDVGEWLLRKKIIDAEGGWLNAGIHGTPADMLPKIEAEREVIGKALGDMTAASPARVTAGTIDEAIGRVAGPLEKMGATRRVGASVRTLGEDIKAAMGLTGGPSEAYVQASRAMGLTDAEIAAQFRADMGKSTVSIQDLLAQRKALDSVVFDNAAVDVKLAMQVKRDLRRELEGVVMDALDEAGGKLPGELLSEYKALKREYLIASIAADTAEDSAARMSKGAVFGLRAAMGAAAGLAAGAPLTGLATAVGTKLAQERGSAAGAVLISRMADMGTLSKTIAAVSDAVGRAAKGITQAPKKAPLPERTPTEPIRVRAARVAERVAAVQANAEYHADRVARYTEALRVNAPALAGGLEQRMTSAAAFLATKIPQQDRDPWDLHPAPRLSDSQAAELVRYANYVERPMRFFEEAERGKVTHEGVEVAKALMPGAFAEFQQRTVEALADMMARGQKPPYAQRERLGILLDVPAVPAQRPAHMKMLQQLTAPSTPTKPSGPNRPMPTNSKNATSTLDRLEGK